MSLVYITFHNENIFNVAKHFDHEKPRIRVPKFESKFKKEVREEVQKPNIIELADGIKLLTSSNKSNHKTLGYAVTPLDPPCAFLRKHGGVKWKRLNEHICPRGRSMPPVPRHSKSTRHETDKTVMQQKEPTFEPHCPQRLHLKNHKHRANFIAVNIERIKTAQTKRPTPRYVDTPAGARHNVLNTGLIPQYICSKNFGRVPVYLRVQKKYLQQIHERCKLQQQLQADKCRPYANQGIRQLTAEERRDILAGLKTNFAEISKIYQGLSLVTDTVAKKLRKGKLEKELRQLEQDMYLMETNPTIFISEY